MLHSIRARLALWAAVGLGTGCGGASHAMAQSAPAIVVIVAEGVGFPFEDPAFSKFPALRRLRQGSRPFDDAFTADAASRTCAVCLRPFTWRRKWARDWNAVRYCSDACSSRRGCTPVTAAVDVPCAAEEPRARSRVRGRALPRGRR